MRSFDDFTSGNLDGIMIYSDAKEERIEHVQCIRQHRLEAGLYLKLKKCKFHMETIAYLALVA